ncbi:UDP-N-acetylglucosamine 2-epimerase (non-hydrolyzing) [Candidatus Wolfebacteria bacterium]|nr:UDP-N-acetylglucosamine 2-epimerase (non-hydrolyzing) [Candidatus Wolfebacteria bacterium]
MKLLLVAGARPNFMKIAPLIHELRRDPRGFDFKVAHTGQHYDYQMSQVFFDELELGEPDYFLGAGGGTRDEQLSNIEIAIGKICALEMPDIVVVVGDVNSTLGAARAAKQCGAKVAHVEAGLRSWDWTMPEEMNRIETDRISDLFFVTERDAVENLKKEGVDEAKIFFVGNIMIDTLQFWLRKVSQAGRKNAASGRYAVLTLHRPSNVDNRAKLRELLETIQEIARDMPVYFPVHPRTKKNIEEFGFDSLLGENVKLLPPLSYMDFLSLWKDAALVLTDSGGIQEETTALGIPCFTIRDNTERPITITEGTNVLVGTTKEGILGAYTMFKEGNIKTGRVPELWDGKTAARILEVLARGIK